MVIIYFHITFCQRRIKFGATIMDISKTNKAEKRIEDRTQMCNIESKRKKLNNFNENIIPTIMQLNDDCFDEIFGSLWLSDLNSIAKTCTRLNQVVRSYFKRKYSRGAVNFGAQYPPHPIMYGVGVKQFAKIFQCIRIDGCYQKLSDGYIIIDEEKEMVRYQCIRFYCSPSLKVLRFENCTLTVSKINEIGHLLSNVEAVYIHFCNIVDDFHACLLKYCVNLKRLYIKSSNFLTNCQWMLRSYPNLEYLELDCVAFGKILEFIIRNPGIRNLTVNASDFSQYIDLLKNSNISFDDLSIEHYRPHYLPTSLLNELHDRGFYNRLHLCNFLENTANFVGANSLGKIVAHIMLATNSDYSFLANVTEICPGWLYDMRELGNISPTEYEIKKQKIYQTELDRVANCMTNLERILVKKDLWHKFRCDILPFIKYAPKLKEIYVYESNELFTQDLSILNEERKKMFRAKKVTIYVDQRSFFEIKCRNFPVDLSLIALKCHESHPLMNIDPRYH